MQKWEGEQTQHAEGCSAVNLGPAAIELNQPQLHHKTTRLRLSSCPAMIAQWTEVEAEVYGDFVAKGWIDTTKHKS